MLPVSGAEQLNASGPIGERPMISHSGAYSRLVKRVRIFVLRQKQIPQTGRLCFGLELVHHRRNGPAVAPSVELPRDRRTRRHRHGSSMKSVDALAEFLRAIGKRKQHATLPSCQAI